MGPAKTLPQPITPSPRLMRCVSRPGSTPPSRPACRRRARARSRAVPRGRRRRETSRPRRVAGRRSPGAVSDHGRPLSGADPSASARSGSSAAPVRLVRARRGRAPSSPTSRPPGSRRPRPGSRRRLLQEQRGLGRARPSRAAAEAAVPGSVPARSSTHVLARAIAVSSSAGDDGAPYRARRRPSSRPTRRAPPRPRRRTPACA